MVYDLYRQHTVDVSFKIQLSKKCSRTHLLFILLLLLFQLLLIYCLGIPYTVNTLNEIIFTNFRIFIMWEK